VGADRTLARSVPPRRAGVGGRLTRERADRPRRIAFVFLDGVGLGLDDRARNPLAAAQLPNLREWAGGAPVLDHVGRASDRMKAIDAGLGVPGRPQSGTGQTALLTGHNAPATLGRHFGPWVPTDLRPLLAAENLFQRATERGIHVTFANCYPAGYMAPGGRGSRRPGAFPLAALSAGRLDRDERDLREGRGLVSSITTDTWRRYVDPDAPSMSPDEAGRRFASIVADHELTLFAHYDTDYVGHRGSMEEAVAAIERVDAFLGSVARELPPDALLLVTSDHGNLEDVTTGHTTNPVPLFAMGPGGRAMLDRVERISGVAPALLDALAERDRSVTTPAPPAGRRSGRG
jgi:2,3-bisphosphoglycerate-independent phosphoglycerate mutase